MNKQTKRRRVFLDELFKFVAFAACIVGLTMLMPHESKFQYQFELGKPWQYDLLMATFDFPIYKSADELRAERNAIIESQHPYFDYDNTVCETTLAELKSKAMTILEGTSNKAVYQRLFKTMEAKITSLYQAGIMSDQDYQNLQENKVESLTIIKDKIGNKQSIEPIYSLSNAIQELAALQHEALKNEPSTDWSFDKWITPNLSYNKALTLQIKNEELNNIAISSGMIQAGERIIDRGEIVSAEDFKILESLKRETESRQSYSQEQKITTLLGQGLLVFSLIILLYLYLRLFRKKYYKSKRVIVLLLTMICSMVGLTTLVVEYADPAMVYIIPFALIPIITSIFFDTRTGLYTHYITIFLASFIVPHPFEFILLQASIGMVAITSLRDISQRSQLVNSALIIVITYSLFYLGYALTIDGNILEMNGWMFAFFFLNGILILLVYPFVFVIEQTFGFISNMRLIELSDVNSPLMRKLSVEAPGTFQHSMQVANLASEIANKIGANPMLARTGALYHDIGKIKNPAFFVENQAKGNNPHQYLTPEASAQIIQQHVSDGILLAKEYKLPVSIVEFISTHHGKSITRYFYNEWCNAHPEEEPNVENFSYPGPNPFTKELAIVMICDTVEAASRSLTEYTDQSISNLIEKLVNTIISEHYLDRAPITLREITEAKAILKEKLANIYHTRIAYPEINKKTT